MEPKAGSRPPQHPLSGEEAFSNHRESLNRWVRWRCNHFENQVSAGTQVAGMRRGRFHTPAVTL